MASDLDQLWNDFSSQLNAVDTPAALMTLKSSFVGKKGKVSEILRSLKDATPEERRELGAAANQQKSKIEAAVADRLTTLERDQINKKLAEKWCDLSLRDSIREEGLTAAGHHPINKLMRDLEDVFLSMGFEVLDGPHIEDDYHNFGALNIPADHPARDMQDTFWFPGNTHVLRTHTSCIQIRGMQGGKPPFQFIGPGQVFRCERTDASHDMTFFQLEGLVVDHGINVANLLFFAKKLFSEIFQADVKIRTRPSYFPFVEPGLEIDMGCTVCNGKGCSVCKHTGWVEMLGCGLIHPNVLSAVGVDYKEYSGFAFGLGVDRLLMMRYGIDDIRHLRSGDLRFVAQFKEYE